jgi:hypothetical protein
MSGELFSPAHLMVLLIILLVVAGGVFIVLRLRR